MELLSGTQSLPKSVKRWHREPCICLVRKRKIYIFSLYNTYFLTLKAPISSYQFSRAISIHFHKEEQGMAQWWEHSPPNNVAWVQIPASTPVVGWVCCWFSPLLREVFLRVLRFSPLLKNQHFQIPIRPGLRQTKNHFVDVLSPNHYLLFIRICLRKVKAFFPWCQWSLYQFS